MTDKDELEIELMNAQIEKLHAETERFRQEMRWEPWKALAALIVAAAAMMGVIITVAHFLPPGQPPVVINLPAQK